jgi:hypothetical protein
VGTEAYERVLKKFPEETYKVTGVEDIRMCCANTLYGSRSVFATTIYGRLPPEMDNYPDHHPISKYQEINPDDLEQQDPKDFEPEEVKTLPEYDQGGIRVDGFKLDRRTNRPVKVMVGHFNGKPIEVRVVNTIIPGVPGFSGARYADEI